MKEMNIIWILGEGFRNYPGSDKDSRYELFDKLSSEGIIFNNMVTAVPSTIMSHSSMLTGQPPTYLGRNFADLNFDDCQFNSLSQILKKRGYHIYFKPEGAELYFLFKKLFLPLSQRELPKKVRNDMNQTSEEINETLDYLLKKGIEKPFFLLLNYNNQNNTEELIGQAIEKIKKRGLFEKTLFIFCPDHGHPDRERNGIYERHDIVLTDANILCPLFISWPGCPIKVFNKPVSSLDILPTILDILDISYMDYGLKGISLLPLMKGTGEYTRDKFRIDCRYIFQKDRKVCIRGELFKYIIYFDRPQGENIEFFDLYNDPDEKNNVISSKDYQNVINDFKEEFEKTEKELINFHFNYLNKKLTKKLPILINNREKKFFHIFLLGSAHPLFIKSILTTINSNFQDYKLDLVIAPGLIEEKEYNPKISFHYVNIKQENYKHTKINYNTENNPLFSHLSTNVNIEYQLITYNEFKKRCSGLCDNNYELVIIPLNNPYGAGHTELIKIVRELRTNKVIYLDYNMDLKRPINWIIKGLQLINAKRRYYLFNPRRMLYEVKRYYLKEVKNQRS